MRINNIILASASPRRKELLKMLLGNFGFTFKIKPADIEENLPVKSLEPENIVIGFSEAKARKTGKRNKGIIIGADTIVVLDNFIIGKPSDEREASKMLKMLSGKKHQVYTGLFILDNIKNRTYKAFEKTDVTFRRLSSMEIRHYVNSGSPMDKAGAYGIQDDLGSTFVSRIEGDYFNVVGLPIVKTYLGLNKFIYFGV